MVRGDAAQGEVYLDDVGVFLLIMNVESQVGGEKWVRQNNGIGIEGIAILTCR